MKYACLLLAGGQGTRLGYNGTKGTFPLGTGLNYTLFDYIILRGIKGGCRDWYIMTSPMNHDETVCYFRGKGHYGIGEGSFNFFKQGVLPCFLPPPGPQTSSSDVTIPSSPLGYKVVLSNDHRISFAPDGNGGVYNALSSSGLLSKMYSSNVEAVHCFSVDNVMVKPGDGGFMGFCKGMGAEVGNKVLWKVKPEEKIGVMALNSSGKSCVVEYSDMSDTDKSLRGSDGVLVYGAGNICNHYYTVDFLRGLCGEDGGGVDDKVRYHVARKAIPYYDGSKVVTPDCPNGVKLETFIFDVFGEADKVGVMEVVREEEFAPVKNKDGVGEVKNDSPEMARRMISELSKRWILDGVNDSKLMKKVKKALSKVGHVEISPTLTYEGEGIGKEYGEEVIKRVKNGETSIIFK